MSRQTGRTTRMLIAALKLIPSTDVSMPIVIVGLNQNHVRTLISAFKKLAHSAGYPVECIRLNTFIVDHAAQVEFRVPHELDQPFPRYFKELFVDHYTQECLPLEKRFEIVEPSNSSIQVLGY